LKSAHGWILSETAVTMRHSESCNYNPAMLDDRNLGKMVPHEPMPFGIVIGIPEVNDMVLNHLPTHDQPIPRWNLQRALQAKRNAPSRPFEQCDSLRDRALKR
jgi:hypothetical protein